MNVDVKEGREVMDVSGGRRGEECYYCIIAVQCSLLITLTQIAARLLTPEPRWRHGAAHTHHTLEPRRRAIPTSRPRFRLTIFPFLESLPGLPENSSRVATECGKLYSRTFEEMPDGYRAV